MADVEKIFAAMSERFQSSKAGDLDLGIEFNLTGNGGGVWHAKIVDGKMNTGKGSMEKPDATLTMDADEFAAMSTGELNPMMAFMSGKIKVDGDLNSVMKFQSLVGM